MTIEEFCSFYNITEDQFLGREVINRHLDLQHVTSIPNGFNPIINSHLDLEYLKEIPIGFNPTIDGHLDLERVTKLPDNFSPIVVHWLDIRNVKRLPIGFNPQVCGYIYLNKNVICGDSPCEESIKTSLKLMIKSADEDIESLALSMLWKYSAEDIKEIAPDKIIFCYTGEVIIL